MSICQLVAQLNLPWNAIVDAADRDLYPTAERLICPTVAVESIRVPDIHGPLYLANLQATLRILWYTVWNAASGAESAA